MSPTHSTKSLSLLSLFLLLPFFISALPSPPSTPLRPVHLPHLPHMPNDNLVQRGDDSDDMVHRRDNSEVMLRRRHNDDMLLLRRRRRDEITPAEPFFPVVIEKTHFELQPEPEPEHEGEGGDEGVATIFACEDVFWSGTCLLQYYKLGSGDCNQLDGKTSAVGPDQGFSCIFYKNAVCRDLTDNKTDSLTLVWPGEANLLDTSKGNFNDVLLGYQCFKF